MDFFKSEINYKNILNISFYFEKIKKNLCFIILSGIFALTCTIITYPGILYSDSYTRIENAKEILKGSSWIYFWNTHVPSYFIALSLQLTNGIALYTFMQAWLFFLITFLFIIRLGKSYRIAQIIIACINPMIWGHQFIMKRELDV
ncbi:MAG: hypothetical protein IKQ25_13950 [Lachnospiraceae bacterium]|nr:hypothetical protein [Lachnospiraceae bacterium]